MGKSYRDQPGGWQTRYYVNAKPGTLKWWKGLANGRRRAQERMSLKKGQEPEPKYSFETEYFD